MKIAVLGATGQTGQHLVDQALQQGHVVTAVVRNPGKLAVHHSNLKSTDSFQGAGCGHVPISAMQEAQVNRIITMTSWYTEPNSGSQSSYLIRFLLLPMIRSVLTNMFEMEQFLQTAEDINWTVVRPPGLKNLPASAQEFLTHEGYFVPDINGHPVGGAVGRGLLYALAWVKKGVAIITK